MQTIQLKVDNSYLESVKKILNNLNNFKNDVIKDISIIKELSKTEEQTKYNEPYFKSKEDEYIFYLVELNGEIQQEKLNIKRILYRNKEKAKKWRNDIIKIIDPDRINHPKATQSAKVLNEIYKEMIKNAK